MTKVLSQLSKNHNTAIRILSTLNGTFNLIHQQHTKDLPPPSQRWTIIQPHPHPQLVICLLHHTKDELIGLAVLPGPYAYVEHILVNDPGDPSIIDDTILKVQGIYEKICVEYVTSGGLQMKFAGQFVV
ncbi:hypothetical protein BDR06DRAFT_971708 [Suillus hirtellus]|nr:hypothetical protein BDR06DRAFT_971708 [Suillus hirtellus]